MDARRYHDYKPIAMRAVLESYERLRAAYEVVLVEGAGSPAEINLRDKDIANMGFAEAVDCPVWLVGDIDRGGVFAHLYGTLALLAPSERARIAGLIINPLPGRCQPAHAGSGLADPSKPASRCWACCPTCKVCISKPRTRCRANPAPSKTPNGCGSPCRSWRGSAITPIFDPLRLHSASRSALGASRRGHSAQ
jgi:hypothetical protein